MLFVGSCMPNPANSIRPSSAPRELVARTKSLAEFLASDPRFDIVAGQIPGVREQMTKKSISFGDALLDLGHIRKSEVSPKDIVEEVNARVLVDELLRRDPSLLGRVTYDHMGLNRQNFQDIEKLAKLDSTWMQAGVVPLGIQTKMLGGGQTSSVVNLLVKDDTFLNFKTEMEFAAAGLGRSVELAFYVTRSSAYDFLYTKRFKGSSALSMNTKFPEPGISPDAIKKEAPIVQLCEQIMFDAIAAGASDISLEPRSSGVRVRFKLNGSYEVVSLLPPETALSVVSRFKNMAEMRIENIRDAQDGRIEVVFEKRPIDVRVNALPTQVEIEGNAIDTMTMRLLDRTRGLKDLDELGMSPGDQKLIKKIMGRRGGIFFISGPTGSGKTTTLYSALKTIDTDKFKVVTVENPVEFRLDELGIIQTQVRAESAQKGLTFETATKAFMRHAPDIILIGEIRDQATADAALQAARSGHLVLATVHANDSLETVARIAGLLAPDPREQEQSKREVTNVLHGVLAQRLVRELCEGCRIPDADAAVRLEDLGITLPDGGTPEVSKCGRGCRSCNYTGFTGRVGMFEFLTTQQGLGGNKAIHEDSKLYQDGLLKVLRGVTPLSEVEPWIPDLETLRGSRLR